MFLKAVLPEERRGLLRQLFATSKRPLRILEAHNGLSAMVVNDTVASMGDGETRSFDGIWISSLTESASRGLPDIELQGMTPRMALIREIMTVTTKPLVVDGDTGGTLDQLRYHVRMLEGMGVSALVIEDKVYPKNNSLDFHKPQVLEDPAVFARKIQAAKQAQLSSEFMLIARIEALVAGQGIDEAMLRAERYLEAGADAIVIHSRSRVPDEVLEFARQYRALTRRLGRDVPLVSIPTLYNSITESELHEAGFRLVIHANYLLRSAYFAMQATAEGILENGRSQEVEPACAPLTSLFKRIEPAGHVVALP